MKDNDNPQMQTELADLVPAIIFETDLTGNVTYMNKAGMDILGYTPDDMVTGLNFTGFLKPRDQERAREDIARILQTGRMASFKYDVTDLKGKDRTVLVNAAPVFRDDSITGIRGAVIDITDQYEKEGRLEMLQSAVKTSIAGLVVATLDTTLLFVNKSLLDMFGYEGPEEVLGKSSMAFWEKPELVAEDLKNLMETGSWSGERNAVKKDGTVFPVQLGVAVIRDAAGNPLRLTASLMDITDLKNVREELAANNELLHQKNIALQELIQQVGREREEMAEQITGNVRQMLLPLLTRYRRAPAEKRDVYLDMLTETLKEITSPFNRKLGEGPVKLTQREIEICNMIKNGLATKEIAALMHISDRTVEIHRGNIRRKLDLSGKKANLQTYLRTL